jgi:iron complex outermembrane recepter protein
LAANEAPKKPVAKAEEEIVVTGSRIRRDSFNSISPMTVITSEQAQAVGAIQAGELLQQSQAAANSGQIDATFTGFITQGGPGVSTVGLRGLGATRTLVLMNGKRLVPAGVRGQVAAIDLNTLPTALIDRIDILKDGASSIYGSDAVAGVVNIITRRNLDGLYLEGTANRTAEQGGEQYTYAATVGAVGQKGNFLANFQYVKQDAQLYGDRDYSNCPRGGTTAATAASSALTNRSFNNLGTPNDVRADGSPICFERVYGVVSLPGTNRGDIVGTDAGLPTYDIGQMRYRPQTGATNATFTTIFGQRINATTGFTPVAPSGAGRAARLGTQPGYFPATDLRTFISPTEVLSAFAAGSRDIGFLNSEFYYEFQYSNRRSSQFSVRQFFPTVSAQNPTNPWGHNPTGTVVPSVPGTAANGFTLTVPTIAGGRTAQPIMPATSINDQEVDNVRFVAGLKGQFSGFLEGWDWDLYHVYGRTLSKYGQNTFQGDRVEAALDLVPTTNNSLPALDIGGQRWTCRVNTVAARNQGPTCVPINLFTQDALLQGRLTGANTLTATGARVPVDGLAYLQVYDQGTTTYETQTVSGFIDGTMFKLPAGDMSGSFGFEYRKESIDDQPGLLSQTGNQWGFTSARRTKGSDSVKELFGEVEIPVLANAPFARQVTLNVSGRYTDYDSYGSATVYKVAGGWDFTDWLSLRATYGTAFRAPALFEQFLGDQSGFITVSADSDPCSTQNRTGSPTRTTNCAADGLAPTFNAATSSWTSSSAGNRNSLNAETSDNLTVGLVIQRKLPGQLGQFNFSVDYSDIKVNDATSQYGSVNIAQRCYDDPAFRSNTSGFCQYVSARDASGALQVRNPYFNIDLIQQRALDLNARYTVDVGAGTLRVDGQASKTLKFIQKTLTTTDTFVGTVGDPEWTAQLSAQYDYKDWRFFVRGTYVGDGDDSRNTTGTPTFLTNGSNGCSFFAAVLRDDNVQVGNSPECANFKVDAQTYFDASVRYRASTWTISGGVNNIADTAPPVLSDYTSRLGNAAFSSQYGTAYLGRRFFVRVSKDF